MNDLISRQEAIDAIEQHKTAVLEGREWDEGIAYGYATAHRHLVEIVRKLPSAQPEQQIPQMRGWVCPVCGRGLSPYTSVCPCNNGKGWEITC